MNKKIPLYHQLLDLAFSLSETVEKGDSYNDKLNGDMYEREEAGEDYYLKQAVVVISPEIFNILSAKSCKLLFRIMNDMKMNNVFWLSGETDPHIRSAITELKKHEILMSTETVGLFIVNPFKLRRGKPMSSIMASIRHYHKDNTVFKLEDLRPPKKALIANGK